MIERLYIKNFAIIEDLEVELEPGFLALSGETGAGKSIIVSALGLLMGEKSSFDKIRLGANKAFIEGVFRIDNDDIINLINDILNEEIEDNQLIITRTLDINNKSVIKINSRTVTLTTLKQISNLIFDIHSQQKDADYLKQEHQLSLLDSYSNALLNEADKQIINEYKNTYINYLNIIHKIDDMNEKQDSLGELEVLQYQLNELEKADIKENEMEDLEEERRELSSFMKFTDRLQSFLNEYSEISSSLYQAKKHLSYINEEEFDTLNEKFNEGYYLLDEVYKDVQDKFDSYSEKISKLDYIQERLYLLHSLRKKYGYTTEDILNSYEQIKINLDELANFSTNLMKLNNEKQAVLSTLTSLANKLTNIRKKVAKSLENDVNKELSELHLEHAEFMIEFDSLNDFTHNGLDKITFMLKANAGGKFLPLDKTASLGETSRLNLALKTVFNDISPKQTIIFDEIDIGISGIVATSITKKMDKISNKSQVIAISHLAQVCAGAKKHYFVKKEVVENKTFAHIKLLTREERVIEIAKMMTGDDSEASLKAAEELLTSFNN